jgi:hypothetical protein
VIFVHHGEHGRWAISPRFCRTKGALDQPLHPPGGKTMSLLLDRLASMTSELQPG